MFLNEGGVMSVWFVSRHQGAIEWIKLQSIQVDAFVEHLNVDSIQAKDLQQLKSKIQNWIGKR